jgi:hypothetical protein
MISPRQTKCVNGEISRACEIQGFDEPRRLEANMRCGQRAAYRHSRGDIAVIDRAGLEARTCECYAVVKKECDRLLPDLTAT